MENRELIIPARFDCKDAVAGLKAIEDSGQVADDLGQAANAASAQFRKAHESIKSAAQEFVRLRRALHQSPDQDVGPANGGLAPSEAGGDPLADSSPERWLESREDVLSEAGTRFGDAGVKATDDRAGADQGGQATLSKTRGIPSQSDAELSDPLMERGNQHLAAAGLPAQLSDERAASAIRSRARAGMGGPEQAGTLAEDLQRGARGGDLESFLGKKEVLGDLRDGRDLVQGPGPLGVEPGETGLLAGSARAATRIVDASAAAGESGAQHRGLQHEAEARLASGGNAEGFDPREGLRRIRTTFPMAVPADEPLTERRRHGPCERGAGHRRGPGSRAPDSAERRSGVPSRGCSRNKTS